jgi:hypothetical protein
LRVAETDAFVVDETRSRRMRDVDNAAIDIVFKSSGSPARVVK